MRQPILIFIFFVYGFGFSPTYGTDTFQEQLKKIQELELQSDQARELLFELEKSLGKNDEEKFFELAGVYRKAGLNDRAIKVYKSIIRNGVETKTQQLALVELTRTHYRLSNLDSVLKYSHLLTITKQNPDSDNFASGLNYRALAFKKKNHFDSARFYYNQLVEFGNRTKYYMATVMAYNNLLPLVENKDSIIAILQLVQELKKNDLDTQTILLANQCIAKQYIKLDEDKKAIPLLHESLDLLKKDSLTENESFSIMYTYNIAASAYIGIHRLDSAFKMNEGELKWAKKLNHSFFRYDALDRKARIYNAISMHKQARNVFRQLLKNERADSSSIFSQLAKSYEDISFDSALYYMNKAIQLGKDIEFWYGYKATILLKEFTKTQDRNLFDSAFYCLEKQKMGLNPSSDHLDSLSYFANMGEYYYLVQQDRQALHQLKMVDSIVSNTSKSVDIFTRRLIEVYKYLANLYNKKGKIDQSNTAYNQAFKYIQQITNEQEILNVLQQDIEARYFEGQQEQHLQLLNEKYRNQLLEEKTLRSRWILILVIIISVSLLLFSIYFFNNKRKQALQKVRNLQITLFRLQMNPHFFYNVLNSIQGYISTNETRKAKDFLSSYSKIMRSTLNSSDRLEVALREEIESIENYLKLENLLAGEFSYEVDVQEEFLNMTIPTFILQPLVENAIHHGLKNKTAGRVKIYSKSSGPFFELIVEDNGLNEIKESDPSYTSSLKLIKSRLELSKTKTKLVLQPLIKEGEKIGFQSILRFQLADVLQKEKMNSHTE